MAARGATVHIEGDWNGSAVKKAQSDLSFFQKQATGFSGSIGKSFLGMGAAIGGAFAIGDIISKVTDFLQQAATAAIEDERSMVSLAKAMDNVGQGFANTEVEKFISDMALATGVADDQLRPAMSKLVTATGDAARAQDLLTTALDVSIGTGRDLASVSQAIARASTGQVSALTRLGIPLDQNIVKTKDFTAAVDVLNQRFGGQASAAADTYGGQLQRLQVAAGEAQETIGYALMDAVENLSEAMGGTGNLNDAILEAGEYAANFVAGMGLATIALTDFLGATDSANKGTQEVNSTFLDTGASFFKMVFHTNLATAALWDWTQRGADYRAEQERVTAANEAATMRYQGMAVALGAASKSQEELAADAATAEESLKALAEEVKDLRSNLSNRQALDDFAKSLRDLGEELKGNTLSFKGMSDSALENRDALRTAFSEAASVIQGFVEEGRISESEFASVFAGTGKKIVDDFAKQGFTRKEIKAFLKSEGLWTDELAAIFSATNNKKALDESERLGYDIASGISVGVSLGAPQVKRSAQSIIADAIAGAKTTYKIKSPSEVTRDELGLPLAQGIVEGLRAGGDEVRKAMQDQFLTAFTEVKERLKGELQDAKAAFNDYRTSVSQAIAGGIDFSAIAPEFDENGQRVGMTFIEALNQQAAQAQQFAVKVKELVSLGLSQAALTQVLEAGVQAGTNIANELITGGASTIEQTNALVASTQAAADEVGQLAATAFYNTGVKNAQDTYDGFKANFGDGGPARVALEKLMDRLAASLNRTSTITVTTVNRVINEAVGVDGKRAAGGPVMANKAYLVGERGPEVLVMGGQSGMIVPNNELPMASGGYSAGKSAGGNTYSISVQAGVGDPRAIGQQVVEYIKKFESSNGQVFAAA